MPVALQAGQLPFILMKVKLAGAMGTLATIHRTLVHVQARFTVREAAVSAPPQADVVQDVALKPAVAEHLLVPLGRAQPKKNA